MFVSEGGDILENFRRSFLGDTAFFRDGGCGFSIKSGIKDTI
jgi:hypothetical protein